MCMHVCDEVERNTTLCRSDPDSMDLPLGCDEDASQSTSLMK